ncbi:acetoin ABC transporter permease [Lactiplantibacillus plajomi]|uniref:Acetoin ABC transporter permease n=1 Tax=Lactiplantibacillus plajomi TaxID=1457217 RepID=A0ABV6K3B0_9LACO|nr:acetoin ABC transporter permease [Lactiplantibacillus plajomi]
MANQKLWQLLWRHYRPILIAAVVALMLVGLKSGMSVVANPRGYIAGSVYNLNNGGDLRAFVAIIVFFALGITMFLHDNLTSFDHYLFGLPVHRRQIYRKKIGLLVTAATTGYVGMQLVYWVTIQSTLTHRHVTVSWGASLWMMVTQWLMLSVLLMVAVTFGLWVGHLFASVVAGVVFSCSLLFAYNALVYITAAVLRVNYRRVDVLNHLQAETWGSLAVIAAVAIVLGGFLYWFNGWGFDHLSLENSQEFFRFPQYRSAVLWFSIIYLSLTTSCSEFGLTVLAILTDNYRSQMPLLTGIVMAIVVAYVTWGLGRWFLYRPDQFRTVWTTKRLD